MLLSLKKLIILLGGYRTTMLNCMVLNVSLVRVKRKEENCGLEMSEEAGRTGNIWKSGREKRCSK